MGLLNVNSGAQGNPLDALLAQNKGSLWGNLGGLLYGRYNTITNGGLDEGGNRVAPPDGLITENDPRYGQAMLDLNGKTQLRNTNIGGPGGVIDPSKVSYDPRYGLLTDPSNLSPLGETFLDKYGPWLLMAPAAYGVLAAGAAGELGGAAAGEAGTGATVGMSGAETIPEVAGANGSMVLPGTEGSAGLLGGAPVVDNSVAASGLSPQGAAPVVDHSFNSAGGLLGNLSAGNFGEAASQAGSWAMSHPLQAAGLLQTGYGLLNRPSKPGSSSSTSKGGNGSAPAGNFSVPQQHFYVNPYIAAQIQRGYQ